MKWRNGVIIQKGSAPPALFFAAVLQLVRAARVAPVFRNLMAGVAHVWERSGAGFIEGIPFRAREANSLVSEDFSNLFLTDFYGCGFRRISTRGQRVSPFEESILGNIIAMGYPGKQKEVRRVGVTKSRRAGAAMPSLSKNSSTEDS